MCEGPAPPGLVRILIVKNDETRPHASRNRVPCEVEPDSPARAISRMVTWPVANTMALGGVATGIMNAQLAARAVGMIRR